jgi:hypothetical protein
MSKLRSFNKKLIKEDVAPNSDIINAINKAVDLWVNDLKRELISGSSSQRSLWDRFKNTLANLWHGRENEKNPYVWTNKLGGLGQTVESIRHYKFSLNEYKYFQEICENLEQTINEEDLPANISKLRIMNIIDKQANNLKNKLADIFKIGIESGKFKIDQMPQPSPEATPQKPTGSPQKPTGSPEATPQKPTGSPQKPTGSPEATPQKPTGSPQKPTESPEQQRLKGPPEQKPTGSPEQQRLKGSPEQQRLKGSPEQKPDTDEDEFSHNNPPTVDKKWTDLEKDEKDAWNTYSGGVTERSLRAGHPMQLPRIIRLGDPRRSILKTPLANQIVSTFDDLLRKGRVETIENPIKSRKELIERIAQAFGERRRTVSEEIPEIPQKPTGEKTSPETPQKPTESPEQKRSTGSPETTPQKSTGEKTSPEAPQKPTASPEQKLTAPGRSGLKGSPAQKPDDPNAETEEQRKEREKKDAEREKKSAEYDAKEVNSYLKHLLSLIKEFEDKEAYSKLFEYYNEISKQLKDILANKNRNISDEQRETRYLHKIFTTIQGLLQEEISKITDPKRREEAEQLWTEIDMKGGSNHSRERYNIFHDGNYYHRDNTYHGKSIIIDYHNFVSHILYNTPYEIGQLNISDKDRDIDDQLFDPRKQDGKNKK